MFSEYFKTGSTVCVEISGGDIYTSHEINLRQRPTHWSIASHGAATLPRRADQVLRSRRSGDLPGVEMCVHWYICQAFSGTTPKARETVTRDWAPGEELFSGEKLSASWQALLRSCRYGGTAEKPR